MQEHLAGLPADEVRSAQSPPDLPGAAAVARVVRERPLLVLLGLLALAVALLWPYRHFAGDDAYITFRFAHNLATGHGFAFNPDVPVYGSTAPLWVFLIAGLQILGLQAPDAAHALNWLFVALNIPLFFKLARHYLGHTWAAVLAVLLMVADPWFIRWSLSGMENGLALFLLMSLLITQQDFRNSGRLNWISPVAAALASLCRPEMTLLSGLLILDILLFERRRLLHNLLMTFLICAVVTIPWIWYAHSHFGSIVPTTIKAKLSSDHFLAFTRVLVYFATFWVFQALAIAAVLVGTLRGADALKLDRDARIAWFLPLAWALVLPTFYVVGGAPVAGRYMMFGLPCYLLMGVKAWTVLKPRFARPVIGSILATLLLIGWVQYRYCWYITQWPQGMDPKMIKLAMTLKEVSKATDIVAGDQIGVLGYFSDRYVLDTYGLASPEILPYRNPNDPGPLWRYVRKRDAQYLFVIDSIDTLSRWDPSYRSLSLVAKADVQREGAGSANGVITYFLYRTNWSRELAGLSRQ